MRRASAPSAPRARLRFRLPFRSRRRSAGGRFRGSRPRNAGSRAGLGVRCASPRPVAAIFGCPGERGYLPRMADRGKNALELRLAAAATPERVAAAATLLANMLRAMAPSLVRGRGHARGAQSRHAGDHPDLVPRGAARREIARTHPYEPDERRREGAARTRRSERVRRGRETAAGARPEILHAARSQADRRQLRDSSASTVRRSTACCIRRRKPSWSCRSGLRQHASATRRCHPALSACLRPLPRDRTARRYGRADRRNHPHGRSAPIVMRAQCVSARAIDGPHAATSSRQGFDYRTGAHIPAALASDFAG